MKILMSIAYLFYIGMFHLCRLLSSKQLITNALKFKHRDNLIKTEMVSIHIVTIYGSIGMYKYRLIRDNTITIRFGVKTLGEIIDEIEKSDGLKSFQDMLRLLWDLDYQSNYTVLDKITYEPGYVGTIKNRNNKHSLLVYNTTTHAFICPYDIKMEEQKIKRNTADLHNTPMIYFTGKTYPIPVNMDSIPDIISIPQVVVCIQKLVDDGVANRKQTVYLHEYYMFIYNNYNTIYNKLKHIK